MYVKLILKYLTSFFFRYARLCYKMAEFGTYIACTWLSFRLAACLGIMPRRVCATNWPNFMDVLASFSRLVVRCWPSWQTYACECYLLTPFFIRGKKQTSCLVATGDPRTCIVALPLIVFPHTQTLTGQAVFVLAPLCALCWNAARLVHCFSQFVVAPNKELLRIS